jgi:tetratricopeptide (TPR) repeat protein
MAHDVFISYTSSPKDKMTANAVCATLEQHGIRCWIAPRDILAGEDWGEAIIDALNKSRALVLIFSASANRSPQIKREVERAVNRGMPVIPFRIEDVLPSKALEYFISTPHWLDAMTPPLELHLEHLTHSLEVLLSRPHNKEPHLEEPRPEPRAPPVPPPPPRPHSRLQLRSRAAFRGSPRQLRVAGAVLSGLVLVSLALLLAREPERYSQLTPQAVEHLVQAETLHESRELESAIHEYTRAIQFDPGAAPAFLGRALARIERAEFEPAVMDASRAIELEPQLAQAYAARAHAFFGKREHEKALADASTALELEPRNSRAHMVRSLVFLARFDEERALEEARKALKQDKKFPWAYLARANAYRDLKQFDEALADYDRAIQLVPGSAFPYLGRARLHLEQGQFQEALSDASKACELGPTVAEAFVMRAIVRMALREYSQAESDATQALRIDPVNPGAYAQRALAHAYTREWEKALEDANDAIRLDARQAVAFLARAMVSQQRGEFSQVIADASTAIDLDARLGQAYLLRGLAQAAQGMREYALRDLDTGIQLEGSNAQVALVHAGLYLQARQYAKAISLLNDALQQAPKDPKLHELLSKAHLLAGNLRAAEQAYRKALALDPRMADKFLGAPITEIQPGSQAARLGLRPGDLILAYETSLLPTFTQLQELTRQPGNGIRELKVVRNREVLMFHVEPGPLGVRMRPESKASGTFQPDLGSN